jgi:hypothetical protein
MLVNINRTQQGGANKHNKEASMNTNITQQERANEHQ